ncbi:MAG TPA: class I SAM-dependent methyltransferase [Acidimicrobiales bacterium]|nr:class I SAM-dependent methyltransferase [Acidimicrobiales bacterium]
MSNVEYEQEEIGRKFDAVRDRRPDAQQVWLDRVALHLPDPVPAVVDVGSGTGIWSRAIADRFACTVHGVEPSDGMRTRAVGAHAHPLVTYRPGRCDALPLADESVGVAWLSTVIHQFPDLDVAARELRRVVEPGGKVLVRSGYPGRQDEIELFHLFPGAMRVAERWPRLGHVITAFEGAGFVFDSIERVREPVCDSYEEMLELLPAMRRSDTALVDLDDEQWDKGIAAIERAIAAGERPWPLGMDLLVMR